MSNPSAAQVNGLEYKKLKHGVTTWPSEGETEERIIELAVELRELCAANQGRNIIVGTNANPRCTCPFSSANHREARVSWCSLYGMPLDWSYFDDVPLPESESDFLF